MVDEQPSEACKKSFYISSVMEEDSNRVTTPFTQCEMQTQDHNGLAFRGCAASLGVVGTACAMQKGPPGPPKSAAH